MENLEAAIIRPSWEPNLPVLIPFSEVSFDSNVEDAKALEYCMRVVETMARSKRNGCQKSVSLLLGRRHDPYLGMPADALYEIFPVLFNDLGAMRAMRFLRVYSMLHSSGLAFNVSTDFSEASKDLSYFPPSAFVAFKLYQPSRWFIDLPQKEREKRLLQKGVVEKTLAQVMEPMLAELERGCKDAKVVVYGPNDSAKYLTRYDALRAAMIEEGIFKTLQKIYGKHPQLILRRDKHIGNVVKLFGGPDYS